MTKFETSVVYNREAGGITSEGPLGCRAMWYGIDREWRKPIALLAVKIIAIYCLTWNRIEVPSTLADIQDRCSS